MYHRKPVVAGSFYPSDKKKLQAMIQDYLDQADVNIDTGKSTAVLSPHAGYIYSGPVAAYSYKVVQKEKPEVVVVLAPSHSARFPGASVIPSGLYETPLGTVEIDSIIGEKLSNESLFTFIEEVHSSEHSLEVQVPFLQTVLEDFKIVPVIIGTVDSQKCRQLASSLAKVLKDDLRKIMVVISSDLSHYHSYESAKELDNKFIDSLKELNPEKVKETIECGNAEACGEGPVLTGIMLSKELGAVRTEILKYANSGDTAGGKAQVVGYVAAAFVS